MGTKLNDTEGGGGGLLKIETQLIKSMGEGISIKMEKTDLA